MQPGLVIIMSTSTSDEHFLLVVICSNVSPFPIFVFHGNQYDITPPFFHLASEFCFRWRIHQGFQIFQYLYYKDNALDISYLFYLNHFVRDS